MMVPRSRVSLVDPGIIRKHLEESDCQGSGFAWTVLGNLGVSINGTVRRLAANSSRNCHAYNLFGSYPCLDCQVVAWPLFAVEASSEEVWVGLHVNGLDRSSP